MKLATAILSTAALLTPFAAQAEVTINIRARIAPQCEVLTVDAVAGSSDIVVRTACNVEQFALAVVQPDGSLVEAVAGNNAAVSRNLDGTIGVQVENPGFQTVRITLEEPVGGEQPVVALTTF